MTCRDEILECVAQIIANTGKNEFSIEDVIQAMTDRGSQYQDSTIRTHVAARMCTNAPQNHAVKYHDLERIETGLSRLLERK